jgi:protein-tyrosine kinase
LAVTWHKVWQGMGVDDFRMNAGIWTPAPDHEAERGRMSQRPTEYKPRAVEDDALPEFRRATPQGELARRSGQDVLRLSGSELDQARARDAFLTDGSSRTSRPQMVWDSLNWHKPDGRVLARNGLFTDPLLSPIAGHFDKLRARILLALAANRWSRIAVSSPRGGAGKSFVAGNLALSLSRLPACRTLLVDFDLRHTELAALFAMADAPAFQDFLSGEAPIETHVRRAGTSLALALNGQPMARPYELQQDPVAQASMAALHDQLQPDVTVIDTPAMLDTDDLLAMSGQVDALLLVSDGTVTTAADLRECARAVEGHLPLLGVVLNRAQDLGLRRTSRRAI